MDRVKVKCPKCKTFEKTSYLTLRLAWKAIAEHEAETTGSLLGEHKAVIVPKPPSGGSRNPVPRKP
jgi:phage FluMu protein Com